MWKEEQLSLEAGRVLCIDDGLTFAGAFCGGNGASRTRAVASLD